MMDEMSLSPLLELQEKQLHGGTWSYTLTDGDWNNLVNGTNIFTATFSKEGKQILEKSQSVNIASDITLTQSSQSIDRTQPKGLSIASQSFLDDDGKLLDYDKDGEADVYQPDIAILPWTTAEQFNLGSDADQTNIAAIKVQSTYSLKGIEVFVADDSKYSIPLSDGTTYTVSVDSQYQTTYDPIAFNISGVEPGSTINAVIYLPSSFSSANSYLRYNYLFNDFRPYIDNNGNPLFSFDLSDPNNKKVTLTLTDGDAQWDGDGTKNGRIKLIRMLVTVSDTGDALLTELSELQALTYIASNPDLITAFGNDTTAANDHYNNFGKSEGRTLDTFNATQYLANYSDLAATLGTNTIAAIKHYILNGFAEGRTYRTPLEYRTGMELLGYNPDLIAAHGTDTTAAIHYVPRGYGESRSTDSFDEWSYLASNADLITCFW